MSYPVSRLVQERRLLGFAVPGDDRTMAVRDTLKQLGGVWDGENRQWLFRDASTHAAAQAQVAKATPAPRPQWKRGRARWSPRCQVVPVQPASQVCTKHGTAYGELEINGRKELRCVECEIDLRESEADRQDTLRAAEAKAARDARAGTITCNVCHGRGCTPTSCWNCKRVRIAKGEPPKNLTLWQVGDCSKCKGQDLWVSRTRNECRDCAVKPGGEFEPF